MNPFVDALDSIASRQVILFGGKGGVGKTTLATAAALHLEKARPVRRLHVESLDAEELYRRFLGENLAAFLEIGDRGTYLDREELQRLFELALPGIDELMTWMRIGELAEENPGSLLIVDTAPTGHTLRMLSAGEHFRQLALALDSMEEKHRTLVRQFARREVRDAMDQFIEDFDARAARRRDLLTDPARTAFVPIALSEPLVVEQTIRLADEVGIDVPFVVLNRAVLDADCALDETRVARDEAARNRIAPRVVVDAPRSCVPLDSDGAIRGWLVQAPLTRPSATLSPPPAGERGHGTALPGSADAVIAAEPKTLDIRPLTFFAGKGGVGKTSCATSIALQLAERNRGNTYTILSVDPAHSLRDVFATEAPPPNLRVEIIDTRERWERFRSSLGREIENAFDALTPRGLTVEHDAEAMRQLVEIAPPGADELFAITRLADLIADDSQSAVLVDTAPTGHFLRLLDLPRTAGEWVREFMRLLLHYRELIPAGSLGEELVRASKSLRELDATLRSDRAGVVVVTRPEKRVLEETTRLIGNLRGRGMHVTSVIANAVTPRNDCRCDRSMREHELEALKDLDVTTVIERRDEPPKSLAELKTLVRWAP